MLLSKIYGEYSLYFEGVFIYEESKWTLHFEESEWSVVVEDAFFVLKMSRMVLRIEGWLEMLFLHGLFWSQICPWFRYSPLCKGYCDYTYITIDGLGLLTQLGSLPFCLTPSELIKLNGLSLPLLNRLQLPPGMLYELINLMWVCTNSNDFQNLFPALYDFMDGY